MAEDEFTFSQQKEPCSQNSEISDIFSPNTFKLMNEEHPSLESHINLIVEADIFNENAVDLSLKRNDDDDDFQGEYEYSSSFLIGDNYEEECTFKICYKETEKITKAMRYTYSKQEDMLFAQNRETCYITFQTSGAIPKGTKIFIGSNYTNQDKKNLPVLRCPYHAEKADDDSDHIILIEKLKAQYGKYPYDEHNYIAIDYEEASEGESMFSIPMRFTCLSTCMGGISRRPFQIVFTLVHGGQVICRRLVPTQLSSCPGRSRKRAEGQYLETSKRKNEMKENDSDIVQFQVSNSKQRKIIVKFWDFLEGHSTSGCKCPEEFFLMPGHCILERFE